MCGHDGRVDLVFDVYNQYHNSPLLEYSFMMGYMTIFHSYDYCGVGYGDHDYYYDIMVIIMMIMMIPRDQDDHYDLWEIRVCP